MLFDLSKILNFNLSRESRIEKINSLMKNLDFIFLGEGRHRRTFLSPNKRYVLKFPHCVNGLEANQREAAFWKASLTTAAPDGTSYAACRLIQNSIIMMRAVSEMYGGSYACDYARSSGAISGKDLYNDGKELPNWAQEIDCGQVGRLRNGKLVAYDYA